MNLNEILLRNWHWKATALSLAVFMWFSIHDWHAQLTLSRTVQVLTAPGDARAFRVTPPIVEVALRTTGVGSRQSAQQGVQVFVDLTDVSERSGVARQPQVHRPPGVEVIKIEPKLIFVERVSEPQTNPAPTP